MAKQNLACLDCLFFAVKHQVNMVILIYIDSVDGYSRIGVDLNACTAQSVDGLSILTQQNKTWAKYNVSPDFVNVDYAKTPVQCKSPKTTGRRFSFTSSK